MNESISTTHNSGNQSALFDRSTVAVYGGTFTLNHSVTTTNANPGLNGEGVLDKAFQKVVVTAMHDNDDVVQAPKCHPGTRTALIGRLIIRAQDTDADCFLIWLVGPAGAGKSSIARSFAEEMEDSGIRFASFFFFRTDPSRNSVKGLVLTLAYQISHSIPEFKQYLALALAENTTIFHRSLPTQFKKLITLPLGQVLASHPSHDFKTRPFVILIDGLDECNDRESRRSFLQLVHKAIPTIPGLRFVVTSRPEEDIQAKFDQFRDEDYEKMELLADISAYDDIRTFLGAEFVRIRTTHPLRKILKEDWPSCRDTEDLVRNSSGHFIYPATAIKYIEYALDNPQRSLQVILGLRKSSRKPLADLDALYGNILDSSRACRKRLRDILSIMIALSELGRSKEWIADTFLIEALLGLEEGDVQLGLLDIRSIVEYDPTSSVPFFHHRSFADFLLHKSRSGDHYIGSVPSFDLLIKKCFQRLSNPRNFLDTGVGPLPPAHLLKNTYHSLVLRWFSRIQQGSHSYGFIRNHLMAYDPLDADEQDFTVSQVGSFYGGQILAICEKFKNLVNDEEIFEFHLAKLDACVVSDIEKMPWPPIVTLNILALRVFPDTFSFDEDSEEKALHKPYKLFPPIQSLVSAFGLGYSPHFRFVGDFFFAEERAGKYWINEDVLVSATRWCFQNLLQIIGHGSLFDPTVEFVLQPPSEKSERRVMAGHWAEALSWLLIRQIYRPTALQARTVLVPRLPIVARYLQAIPTTNPVRKYSTCLETLIRLGILHGNNSPAARVRNVVIDEDSNFERSYDSIPEATLSMLNTQADLPFDGSLWPSIYLDMTLQLHEQDPPVINLEEKEIITLSVGSRGPFQMFQNIAASFGN